MWLVTGQASDFRVYLGDVRRIRHVGDGMSSYRMSQPILKGQDHDFVLGVVILRQLHRAVEDGDHVLRFQGPGRRLGPVALEAQRIGGLGPQEVLVVATMRFVTGGASLSEGRLMEVRLLHLVALFAVTGQAGVHRIGLNETGGLAGMGIVTSRAVALRARMLHLGSFNFFRLLAVTGHANRLRVSLRQDYLAILRRLVTGIAGSGFEGSVGIFLHQMSLRRLVRIVALNAIGCGERLSVVCLHQVSGSGVVTVEAKCRRRFGEVIVEFLLALLAGLVRSVAGFATHVEGGVTASVWRNIQSLGVTIKAKILALVAGGGLQQLIFIVGLMRTVALNTIADGGRMNGSLDGSRVHVSMARDAKRLRRRRSQLDASDVFVHPDLMTSGAPHRDCGVNELTFGFVFVTLDACRRTGIWL